MEQLSNDCKNKLEAAHNERIEFTTRMMKQFEEMKRQHQNRYSLLEKKYNELEYLFDERPSRGEDVAAIRNLQNQKEKMDIQVKSFQKKAQTANEIVKYLNLELENYKDTYHLFGGSSSPSGKT